MFNSDNCGGDDFYYTTERRMMEAIDYWSFEYSRKGFVRWAVVDKYKRETIGTIELFCRNADDYFTNCGILRLDIRSDYENADIIEDILSLIVKPAFDMFKCDKIATKAIAKAEERISALKRMQFKLSEEMLIGHDGTKYGDYYVLNIQ